MSELRRACRGIGFEGHRFNDLRRWLLLDKAPYTQKKLYFDRATDQTNDVRFGGSQNGQS